MNTPRLTHHARQRCAEMGVHTKRVKRIAADPDVTRPSGRGILAKSDNDPEIAVVYVEDSPDQLVILTVLPNTDKIYNRPEHTEQPA